MPRLAVRQPAGSASRSSSKRSAPTATPTRQSKRTKATPTKSQYFDPSSEIDDNESEIESLPEEASGYEENGDSEEASPDSGSEEDLESEDEEVKHRKKSRSTKASGGPSSKGAKVVAKGSKASELWRPGVKTGLGPGTQVIIKKPKAREAGSTPYTDDTIHPNTMLFLKDLAAHNDREWLKMHDPDYRTSLKDFHSFIECLTEKIIEADETIPELPIKDIFFRIYRDVRFSSDQTPYKTHFSAAWSRTGRKGPYAAYYVQIQPGGSFVGGGLWHPEAQPLAALRRDIDRKPHKIKRVLTDSCLRKEFFGGVKGDEKKVVRAFAAHNAENALKKKPKDYVADHRDIELLRLRNFTIGKKLSDEEVVGSRGLGRISELISMMVPWITYLNSVVMPDDEDSSSDESESEDAGVDEGDDD